MKKYFSIAVAALLLVGGMQAKKTLGHDDFDFWQKLTNISISNNGKWAVYAVNPQEGDGVLTFYETVSGKRIDIPRGSSPVFTKDGKWALATIKPFYAATRQAKIAKKKGFDLPQDSLAIIDLSTGKIEKIGNVISSKTGKDGGDWIAWLSCDTTLIKPKALKDSKAGRPLVMKNLKNGTTRTINWVKDYLFSNDGSKLALTIKKQKSDTLSTDGTGIVMLPDTAFHLIDRDKVFYGVPVFNEAGSQLAYIASNDSAETGTKKADLYLVRDLNRQMLDVENIQMDFKANGGDKLYLNQYSKPVFSENGKRLVVGVAPYIAPDDTTLVSFETPGLDIWRWDAPYTPPQELNRVERIKKQTFPVVINLSNNGKVLMTDNPLVTVAAPDRWDGDWALVSDRTADIISAQWDYQYPVALSLKNVLTGESREIGTVANGMYRFSTGGNYVVWFDNRQYYSYCVADGTTNVIGSDIEYPLWDEDTDTPVKIDDPYGFGVWTENDGRLMVYDRYDMWSVDPKGKSASICETAGEGRKRNLKMRLIETDPDFRFLNYNDPLLFSLFDYADKRNGLATSVYKQKGVAPKIDFLDGYKFTQVCKAKDAAVYSWNQGNFSTSPNVYVTRDIEKGKAVKVSDTNPQMADYKWGTAQLFKWRSYDGNPSDGVLYLPEDFDPNKEYPMLVYFYETYSEELYKHYDMEPSWSWINFPFYVSRDYVVFVPDIHYTAGIPGECAYNYVCSGVEAVCAQYPNIDKKRIGIDGQSWGGYQTAYLVTRTNMFACAGSGAPVANMTSAFGGIRWESGSSRQGQYEQGQSRIGRNLWDATELYIANSPVFHANRVETPLLIMHNDADGAVPWYQGIELFMALRRLGKPVWMLQYNGEAHNLKERRNRKDITRRLQQFFDHYLKGDPMPEWMKNGIPVVRKGQEFGY